MFIEKELITNAKIREQSAPVAVYRADSQVASANDDIMSRFSHISPKVEELEG